MNGSYPFGKEPSITTETIEAYHRLPAKKPGPKPTIVRFASRKTVDIVMKNKIKLKSIANLPLDLDGLDAENGKINPSFCPHYKNLAYNCRQLKNGHQIASVLYEDDATLKIKLLDGSYVKVQHEKDLMDRFPAFSFSF